MGEQDELRFARLCDGGRLAHYLSPGMVTGARPRLEHFADRESVRRRFANRVKLGLSVAEDRRALEAFSDAYGEIERLLYPFLGDESGKTFYGTIEGNTLRIHDGGGQ